MKNKKYPRTISYTSEENKVLKITNSEKGFYIIHGDIIEGVFIFEDGKRLTLKKFT